MCSSQYQTIQLQCYKRQSTRTLNKDQPVALNMPFAALQILSCTQQYSAAAKLCVTDRTLFQSILYPNLVPSDQSHLCRKGRFNKA